jgi:hypothetical protein
MVLLAGVTVFALSDNVRFVVCSILGTSIYGVTTAGDVDKAAALEQAIISKTIAM